MPIDRKALKLKSQELIRVSTPKPLYAGLIMLGLSIVMSLLSSSMIGIHASEADLIRYAEYIEDGNFEFALRLYDSFRPSFGSYVMGFVINLAYSIVSVGFVIFLLNTIRNTGACYGNLLDGFGFSVKIIWLTILEGIFISLWSLLLFIPGIIASYRYRMAVYILIDNPEMSALNCIRESKRMMTGRKGELFILDVSFIGWSILASLPILRYLVQVWTIPYINLTHALYYETLKNGAAQASDYSSYDNPNTPPPWEG